MEIWDVYDSTGVHLNKTIQRGDTLLPGEFHVVVHLWLYNRVVAE